jgi:AraC-like DNA-binding protein
MFAIPLPFVVALLLWILLVRLWVDRDPESPGDRAALLFIAACALSVTLVGIRWTVPHPLVRMVRADIAALIPPIAWFCFAPLARSVDEERAPPHWTRWLHALPVLLIVVLSAQWWVWHPPLDTILSLQHLGYGLALARLGLKGVDGLGAARLGDAIAGRRGILVAALVLIANALVDTGIALDFEYQGGRHAADIVAGANAITIILISLAAALVRRGRPGPAPEPSPQSEEVSAPADPDDQTVHDRVERVLVERGLYKDPDLTLNRLARATGLPARRLSQAINRLHGENMSRFVNGYRILEAQRLLRETADPVTGILYDCGFQTKSNFNREFQRITGQSPSAYRAAHRPITAGSPPGTKESAR